MSEETQKPLEHPFYLLLDEKVEELRAPKYSFDDHSPLEYFGPINHVNILVGANNSGKSRFMRGLIKSEKTITDEPLSYKKLLNKLNNELEEVVACMDESIRVHIMFDKGTSYFGIRFNNHNKCHTISSLSIHELIDSLNKTPFDKNEKVTLVIIHSFIRVLLNQIDDSYRSNFDYELYVDSNELVNIEFIIINKTSLQSVYQSIETFLNSLKPSNKQTKNIYIPFLRNVHSMYNGDKKVNESDFIAESIHRNYFINFEHQDAKEHEHHDLKNENQMLKIYSGMNLHRHVSSITSATKPVRESFAEFEAFIGKNFFGNQSVKLIARLLGSGNENNEHLYFNTSEKDDDIPIHNMGDGVQSLIMLLYSVYTAGKNSWIYIEEPEISLHPGLQRTFLEAIIKQAKEKNLTVLFTTHSNHLLDISIEQDDVSIFTFNTEKDGTRAINHVPSGDNEILRLLGVNNSSVFMANCSVWIEGHTDRKYIKAYLKAYIEHLGDNTVSIIEDLDYTFFEYAGSNIMHYLFEERESGDDHEDKIKALSVSNNILLIADRDGENKTELHKERKEIEQRVEGFRYEVLPEGFKEIENLISKDILKIVVPNVFSKLKATKETIDKIDFNTQQSIIEFLKSCVTKEGEWGTSYEKSNTLHPNKKAKLCNAVTKVVTWDIMSKEAQDLAILVYEFIKNNKKSN